MSEKALERLKQRFGEAVLETHSFRGDDTAVLDRAVIVEACSWLKSDPELLFDMLADMTAVDYLPRDPRFEVVYQLYSVQRKHRLRLKVRLSDKDPTVDTMCELWPIANWLEREIWDLYGIRFRNHPNLKRILLYEEFVGHPLRKDYPKEKRQPLVRRPASEIAEVLVRRGQAQQERR